MLIKCSFLLIIPIKKRLLGDDFLSPVKIGLQNGISWGKRILPGVSTNICFCNPKRHILGEKHII